MPLHASDIPPHVPELPPEMPGETPPPEQAPIPAEIDLPGHTPPDPSPLKGAAMPICRRWHALQDAPQFHA